MDENKAKIFQRLANHKRGLFTTRHQNKQKLAALLEYEGLQYLENIRDNEGNTILHAAVSNNLQDIILWLLKRYPDHVPKILRVKNGDNETPLELAERLQLSSIKRFLTDPNVDRLVEDRAKQFVTHFVSRYLGKLEKYRAHLTMSDFDRIAGVKQVPLSKIGTVVTLPIMSLLGTPVLLGAGSLLVVSFAGAFISSFNETNEKIREEKMRKIVALHESFYEGEVRMTLNELLIRAGFEIFSRFEQFMLEGFDCTKWTNRVGSLAEQCVIRIFNHASDVFPSESKFSEHELNLSEFFLKGTPNSGIATFTVLINKDQWEVVRQCGMVCFSVPPSPTKTKFYLRHADALKDADKFGYRKLFNFEMTSNHPFHVKVDNQPWNAYDFVLTPEKVESGVEFLMKTLFQDQPVSRTLAMTDLILSLSPALSPINEVSNDPVHFGVQAPAIPFIERRNELAKIESWFADKKNHRYGIFVIKGFTGVGKTEIAAKYVEHFSALYNSKANIIWMDGNDGFANSFYDLYISCELGDLGNKMQPPIDRVVQECYRYLSGKPTLVVFDNADTPDDIEGLLPRIFGSGNDLQILITSHSDYWVLSEEYEVEPIGTIRVCGFTTQEAVAYLKKLLEFPEGEEELPLLKIARLMDYSPLALQQVAAYVSKELRSNKDKNATMVITEFVSSFSSDRREYDNECWKMLSAKLEGHDTCVIQRWNTLFGNMLESGNIGEVALSLANVLSYMAFVPVQLEDGPYLEILGTDRDTFIEAVYLLCNYYVLVQPRKYEDEDTDEWFVHGLVRKVIRCENASDIAGREIVELDKVLRLLTLIMKDEKLALIHAPHFACVWRYAIGHEELVRKYLIDYDYNQNGSTFLHEILVNATPQNVSLMVETLSLLVKSTPESATKLQIIANSKRSWKKQTPLHLAVMRKCWTAANMFLEWRACVQLGDLLGWTPIHHCVHVGNVAFLEKLLETEDGRNVLEWKTHEGLRPLHIALKYSQTEVATTLIKDFAVDVGALEARDGYSPLLLACENKLKGIVKLLLSKNYVGKVDVNTTVMVGGEEVSPLKLAIKAWGEGDDIVSALKKEGAF